MRYADIANMSEEHASPMLANHFDINPMVANAVLAACHEARDLGMAGLAHVPPVASRDLVDLVHDAWHDGIVSRRLVVNVRSGELQCTECGATYLDDDRCPHHPEAECTRTVTLTVTAPFAEIWADWDQTIVGNSWETPRDMPDFAYAHAIDHPGLIADLRINGYALNLAEYES